MFPGRVIAGLAQRRTVPAPVRPILETPTGRQCWTRGIGKTPRTQSLGRTIAPKTQHSLPDIAVMRLRLPDSMVPPRSMSSPPQQASHPRQRDGDLTDRKQTPLNRSVNVRRERLTRQRALRPVARGRFREGRGNRTAFTLPIQRKIAEQSCHDRTHLALMRLDGRPPKPSRKRRKPPLSSEID
jgi:hypothetical protein